VGRGTAPLLVTRGVLLALLAARERPGRLGWIGAALVVAGAFLAAA
jgi:drug/metabolite transporter (DMT)-like permease